MISFKSIPNRKSVGIVTSYFSGGSGIRTHEPLRDGISHDVGKVDLESGAVGHASLSLLFSE
jgi:hypothetical protein